MAYINSWLNKNPNGSFTVFWRQKGRQKQQTFKFKADALRKQKELFEGCRPPESSSTIKFAEFVKVWVERHSSDVEQSTMYTYERDVRNHLIPFFGEMDLADIDSDDVDRFRQAKLKTHAPKTVRNLLLLLNVVFECACQWKNDDKRHYILHNPAMRVRRPSVPEPDTDFLHVSEIRKLFEYAVVHEPKVYRLACFFCHTGVRRGEAYAFQSTDIDFEARILTIRRSFSFKTWKLKHLKNKKIKYIPMNSELEALLLPFKGLDKGVRVFKGYPVEHFAKRLKAVCKKAGVKEVTTHELRHSFISNLGLAGHGQLKVMAAAGHTDPKMWKRYSHVLARDLEGLTDCLVTGVNPAGLRLVKK